MRTMADTVRELRTELTDRSENTERLLSQLDQYAMTAELGKEVRLLREAIVPLAMIKNDYYQNMYWYHYDGPLHVRAEPTRDHSQREVNLLRNEKGKLLLTIADCLKAHKALFRKRP